MIARRAFLAGLAAAGVTAPRLAGAAIGKASYLAAAKLNDGTHALIGFDPEGTEQIRLALPARARAGAAHPARPEAVVFATPPDRFALVVDLSTGTPISELSAPEGQVFNPHGVYADGGATLLTSEATVIGAEGRIGLWDVASGYTRIGEIPSHGRAPHDLRLMPDGRTLVVANGGLAPVADSDGTPGPSDTAPSLAYISLAGDLLEEVRLAAALRPCSIRHLALRADGLVGFAMHWEGEPDMGAPLLGLHRRGETPSLIQTQQAGELAMKGTASATAFSADGSEIAIISNRGGRLHRFTAEGLFLGADILTGVGGIAPHPAGFIVTDGYGGLFTFGPDGARPLAEHDLAWEDHILTL